MRLNEADWVLLAVIGVSALVGVQRGLVRELLGLLTWIVAGWLSLRYSEVLSGYLTPWVELPSLRKILGFAVMFVIVVVVGSWGVRLLHGVIKQAGLGVADAIMGALFGGVRGVLIALIAVTLAGLTPLPQDPWWSASRVIAQVQPLSERAIGYLPDEARDYFNYSTEPGIDSGHDEGVGVFGWLGLLAPQGPSHSPRQSE